MIRRNKFNAKPTMLDGVQFASKREAKRYLELRLLQNAGQISGLELQPIFHITINGWPVKIRSGAFPNGRKVKYIADFAYMKDGERIVEDSKGMDTPVSRLKRALVEATCGVRVQIV